MVLLVGGAGFTGGAPSFLVLAFFTFSLMASMSSLPSVGAVTETRLNKGGIEVSCTVPVHRVRQICFALR